MVKYILFYSLLVISPCWAMAQAETGNFYAVDALQEINLVFGEKNWSRQLDSLRINGNEMLTVDVWINGTEYKGAGLRYKYSRGFTPGSKRNSMEIALDQSNPGANYQGHSKIYLSSALRDPSMIREVVGYEIAGKYMPAPGANFAKVNVGGNYFGLYVNVEVIDEAFLAAKFGSGLGSMFKSTPNTVERTPDGCKPTGYGSLQEETGEPCFQFHFTKNESARWSELQNLTSILNAGAENIESVLEVDQVLWMHAFNNVLVNLHSYSGQHSPDYYLYKNAQGKFQPIVSDLNLAFGSFKNTGIGSDIKDKDLGALDLFLHRNDAYWPLISKLLSNELYMKLYVSHVRTILQDFFFDNQFTNRAKELHQFIQLARVSDSNQDYSYEDFQKSLTAVTGKLTRIPGIITLMNERIEYYKNQRPLALLPPQINNVGSAKREYLSNQQVSTFKIQAQVDRFPKDVVLYYRFNAESAFAKTMMLDDGQHQDKDPGDKIFGVEITPPAGISNIEYYIFAENAAAVAFFPKHYMNERVVEDLETLNK